jgi:hypothetical protein
MRITLPTPVTLALLISFEGVALAQSTDVPGPASGNAPQAPAASAPASQLPTSEPVTSDTATAEMSHEDVALQAQAEANASALPASEADAGESTRVPVDPAHRSGFTSGLRLGVGIPVGKAGEDATGAERDLGDLTPWSAPVWVDVGYAFSGRMTLGAYGQVAVGGTGDACQGDCDWSSIRVGAQAELRLAPGAAVDPWIGVGLGWEWLSFRTLLAIPAVDADGAATTARLRATERFAGPELSLQLGLDFQVEDALRIGPYIVASAGPYVKDSYTCDPDNPFCPSDSTVDGGAFHSWLGLGLRGAYTP